MIFTQYLYGGVMITNKTGRRICEKHFRRPIVIPDLIRDLTKFYLVGLRVKPAMTTNEFYAIFNGGVIITEKTGRRICENMSAARLNFKVINGLLEGVVFYFMKEWTKA